MSLFTNLLDSNLIHAIGWAILHSLWQIAIIGTILSVLLLIFRRKPSLLKYYLSVGAFLVITILSLFTFYQQYNSVEKISTITEYIPESETGISQSENTNFETLLLSQLTLKEKVKFYVNNNIQIIVSIWYICVLLLFLKMLAGFIYSQRIKTYGTSAVSTEWSEILERLTKKLKINKSIKLLESALVKVPVMIGFLKPVILLPIGVVSGLSIEQLEAILAHEVAHIKRNDYLINLLHSIFEILFFYHPVIWWISKNIRNERENACDDLAILLKTDRTVLAKALANIEFINKKQNQYVMALNGNKNNLFNRIKRLVEQPKIRFSYKEGLIGASLIILSLLVMSFSINTYSKISGEQAYKNHKAKTFIARKNNKLIQNSVPSLPENNFDNSIINAKNEKLIDDTIVTINLDKEVIYKVNKTKYTLRLDDDKNPVQFLVNGTEIPKDNWESYSRIFQEALSYLLNNKEYMEFRKQKMQEQKRRMKEHEIRLQMQTEELQKQLAELEVQTEKLKKITEENEKNKKELDEKKRQEESERLKNEYDKLLLSQKLLVIEHKKLRTKNEKLKVEHEKLREKEEKLRMENIQLNEKREKLEKEKEKSGIFNELIEEMKKEKLLDPEDIGYKVHFFKDRLLINDVKQSQKTFEKYKQKFEEKSKGRFELDYQLNYNSNFINIKKGSKPE